MKKSLLTIALVSALSSSAAFASAISCETQVRIAATTAYQAHYTNQITQQTATIESVKPVVLPVQPELQVQQYYAVTFSDEVGQSFFIIKATPEQFGACSITDTTWLGESG